MVCRSLLLPEVARNPFGVHTYIHADTLHTHKTKISKSLQRKNEPGMVCLSGPLRLFLTYSLESLSLHEPLLSCNVPSSPFLPVACSKSVRSAFLSATIPRGLLEIYRIPSAHSALQYPMPLLTAPGDGPLCELLGGAPVPQSLDSPTACDT